MGIGDPVDCERCGKVIVTDEQMHGLQRDLASPREQVSSLIETHLMDEHPEIADDVEIIYGDEPRRR